MVTWMTMPEDQTEREKFLRLYGACEKRVYAAAFRVLRDPAPAEDAAQQAWFRLLQSWERVSTFGLEEACGYAVTVAKNAAIDLLRAQRHTVSFRMNGNRPRRRTAQGNTPTLSRSYGRCRRATAVCWSSSSLRNRATRRSLAVLD